MACTVQSTKLITQVRDIHREAMEKALNVWVEDNAQKNVPLSGPLVHEKAKRIYDHLVGAGGAAAHECCGYE